MRSIIIDVCQSRATVERIVADACHAVGDDDGCNARTVIVPRRTAVAEIRHRARAGNGQRTFVIQHPRDVLAARTRRDNRRLRLDKVNRRARQRRICNRIPLLLCAAVIDVRQRRAVAERPVPDARHAVGNRDRLKTRAVVERTAPDARHAVGDRDRLKTRAVVERPLPDARHAVGNRDRLKTRAVVERPVPDNLRIRTNRTGCNGQV